MLAVLGLLLLGLSCVLALSGAQPAPAWLFAPAACLAAIGCGGASTLTVLGLTQHGTRDAVHGDALDPGAELLRGGAMIGAFERLAIAATLMLGWPEGLAVVLAVKGLGRFAEVRARASAAERFILGTLVSVLVAAACAGAGWLVGGGGGASGTAE